MSRGCVVFASNIDNHQEIIEHGKNGFLFDFENNNFLEFFYEIKSDVKTLERVSKNAYNYISEHNSLQNYVIEEVKEYKKHYKTEIFLFRQHQFLSDCRN